MFMRIQHMELCKRLNFDHNNKWHINKPESFLWALGIQTDYWILFRSSNLKRKHVKERKRDHVLSEEMHSIHLYSFLTILSDNFPFILIVIYTDEQSYNVQYFVFYIGCDYQVPYQCVYICWLYPGVVTSIVLNLRCHIFLFRFHGLRIYLVGGVCNLVISVDCSLNYSHHKYSTKTLQSRKKNGIEHNEH